jgi:hypothetical protein
MTDIYTIPQNKDTCWFNSILTVSLFSQRTSKIVYEALKELYKTDKTSIISILKYIHKNKPNFDYYVKIRADLLLYKFIKKYDIELFNRIKKRLYNNNNKKYFNDYIYEFYKILKIDCAKIVYNYDLNENYIYKQNGDNYNNPKVLLVIYESNDLIEAGITKIPLIHYDNIIQYNNNKYVLDACLISNNDNYHSISGITYNNTKYIYNGSINQYINTSCKLIINDWNINNNRNFSIDNCKIIYEGSDESFHESSVNYYNLTHKENKVLVYILDNSTGDEMNISYSRSLSKKSISNIESIVYDIHDYYNIFSLIENDINSITDTKILNDLKTKFKIDEEITNINFKRILNKHIEELLNKLYMNIDNTNTIFNDNNLDLLKVIKIALKKSYNLDKNMIYKYTINIGFNSIISLTSENRIFINNIYELLNIGFKIPFDFFLYSNEKLNEKTIIDKIKIKINDIIDANTYNIENKIFNNIFWIVYLYSLYINNDDTSLDYKILLHDHFNKYKKNQIRNYSQFFKIYQLQDNLVNSLEIYQKFSSKYKNESKEKYKSNSSSSYNESIDDEELQEIYIEITTFFNKILKKFIINKVLSIKITDGDVIKNIKKFERKTINKKLSKIKSSKRILKIKNKKTKN